MLVIFFQVILSETANRIFLAESGRKILSALITRARKVSTFVWLNKFKNLLNKQSALQTWLSASYKIELHRYLVDNK